MNLPAGESILSVTPDSECRAASQGRVLGSRKVLYKYLNPNLITIAAYSAFEAALSVYVMDSVTGHVLYSTYHHNALNVGGSILTPTPFYCVMCENWIVYHFWSKNEQDEGWWWWLWIYSRTILDLSSNPMPQLNVLEFFESNHSEKQTLK